MPKRHVNLHAKPTLPPFVGCITPECEANTMLSAPFWPGTVCAVSSPYAELAQKHTSIPVQDARWRVLKLLKSQITVMRKSSAQCRPPINNPSSLDLSFTHLLFFFALNLVLLLSFLLFFSDL